MAGPDSGGDPDPYLAHRDLIEQAIRTFCRRQRLSATEAEDFASEVRLHLLDRERAVLRAFEGRSSFQTYLLTVIRHLFRDWRNALWGKWRPSAEARRLGPLAVRLEMLLVRDRLPFDQAEELLRTAADTTASRAALEALAARLPVRHGRAFVTESALGDTASAARTETALESAEARAVALRARTALDAALAALPAGERLILKMRFDDGLRIVDIARMLNLDQKRLYRQIETVLRRLRAGLEATGLGAAAISTVIAHRGFDLLEAGRDGRPKSADEVRLRERDDRAPLAPERVP